MAAAGTLAGSLGGAFSPEGERLASLPEGIMVNVDKVQSSL